MTGRNAGSGLEPGQLGWRGRLAVLTGAHAIGTANIMSVLVLGAVVRNDLALTAASFGLLMAAYNGAQATVSLLLGAFVDRIGVARALLLAKVILIAGAVTFQLATGLASALLGTALMGLGYALINPSTSKAVLEWVPLAYRATGMGIKQTGVPLGGILAAGLGALAVFLDWRTILLIVAALNLAGILPVLLLPMGRAEPARASNDPAPGWSTLVTNRNLNVLNVSTAAYNVGQGSFWGFLSLFLRDVLGASQVLIGTAVGASQAAGAAGRVLWGIAGDRLFRSRRKLLYMLVGGAAAILFLLFALVQPGWIVTAVVLSALLGLTIGAYAPIGLTMAVEAVPPRQSGAATGYHVFAICTAGIFGPPLVGAVIDWSGSYAVGWLTLAAVCAAATLLLAFGLKEREMPGRGG